ncbi:MAG: ATP-binding protein, partial [Deltaproteobacteria bacterium]
AISPDHLGKIFNPFFTTRQQGTGLGLAITQRIIEQHHGEILVTSPHEKGATFTILLPYLADGKESGGAENYAAEDTRRG